MFLKKPIYIPVWLDKNEEISEMDKGALEIYIPVWLDKNFKKRKIKSLTSLFTFQYG